MVSQKTVYVTEDGSQFETEVDALEYEKWVCVLGAFTRFLSWYGCYKTPIICDLKRWVSEHREVFKTILDDLDQSDRG
jgi:hypothetical protein